LGVVDLSRFFDYEQPGNAPVGKPQDKALFLARHWAGEADDGTVRLSSDPRHKLPLPIVYRIGP